MTQIKVEVEDKSYSSYQARELPMPQLGAPDLASASPSQSPEPYCCRYKTQESVSQDFDRTYNVFIGGLRTDTTKADLESCFGQCGRIISAKVLQKPDRRGKLYGFVNFGSQEAQRRALARDGAVIKSVSVRVRPQHEGGERKRKRVNEVDPAKSLFIGNVPYHLPPERLQEMIEQKGGQSIEVRLKEGFAFVVYDTIMAAEQALERLNGSVLEPSSDPLFVEFVRSPAERDAIQGGSPVEEVERHRRTVFISNLPPDIGDGDLHANFAKYGHITTVYIPRNAQNMVKGYAFLEFSKRAEAHSAAVGGPVHIRDRLVQVRKSLIQNSDKRKSLPSGTPSMLPSSSSSSNRIPIAYPFTARAASSEAPVLDGGKPFATLADVMATEKALQEGGTTDIIAIMKAAFEAGAKAGEAERRASLSVTSSPELAPGVRHSTPPALTSMPTSAWASAPYVPPYSTPAHQLHSRPAQLAATPSPAVPSWINAFSPQPALPTNPVVSQYWQSYMENYHQQYGAWYENMQRLSAMGLWNQSREGTPEVTAAAPSTRSRTRSPEERSRSSSAKSVDRGSSSSYGAYRPRRSHRSRHRY